MVTSALTYTLRFLNKSGSTRTFVCCQPPPGQSQLSLAWFAMPAANGAEVNFSWQQTYDLVWLETGEPSPGVGYGASQVAPAAAGNSIRLTYADGALAFADQGRGEPSGQLRIECDGSIPPNTVSVGFGMAGSPTTVVQAVMNTTSSFTPFTNYWVTAVTNASQGEVIVVEQANAAHVVFPPNVTAMTAIPEPDGTWGIGQGLVFA
jgi:hypothetical protein